MQNQNKQIHAPANGAYAKPEAAPYKVFATREEWERELRNILMVCVKKLRGRGEREDKPQSREGLSDEADLFGSEFPEEGEEKGFSLFRLLTARGMSPEEAYERSLPGQDDEKKPAGRAQERRKRGIRENGATNSRTGVTANDPASMSDGDFRRYIKRIMGGNL